MFFLACYFGFFMALVALLVLAGKLPRCERPSLKVKIFYLLGLELFLSIGVLLPLLVWYFPSLPPIIANILFMSLPLGGAASVLYSNKISEGSVFHGGDSKRSTLPRGGDNIPRGEPLPADSARPQTNATGEKTPSSEPRQERYYNLRGLLVWSGIFAVVFTVFLLFFLISLWGYPIVGFYCILGLVIDMLAPVFYLSRWVDKREAEGLQYYLVGIFFFLGWGLQYLFFRRRFPKLGDPFFYATLLVTFELIVLLSFYEGARGMDSLVFTGEEVQAFSFPLYNGFNLLLSGSLFLFLRQYYSLLASPSLLARGIFVFPLLLFLASLALIPLHSLSLMEEKTINTAIGGITALLLAIPPTFLIFFTF